jgi:hypothetical protein
LAHIDGLRQTGHSFAQIAAHLHRAGFAPPKRTERFTGETVARLLSRHGLHGPRPRAMDDASVLRAHEYWLADLAREVPMPIATLHTGQRVGWVHSRTVPVASGRWALWANADALERLRQLRAYQRTWPAPRYPQALTTPKRCDMSQQRACRSGSRVPFAPQWRPDGLTKRDNCAMTSRTKSTLPSIATGSKGVPQGPSARTPPTTSHRQLPCRRPYRGHLPGIGLLEKLALQMAGSLPSHGSLLERSTEQTPQNHPDQNGPTYRTGRRGPAPDADPAWQRLWCRFDPAGARTPRDRAYTFTANDLSDSPPRCNGGDLNQPPSYMPPSARKIFPVLTEPHSQGNMAT